MIDTSNPKVFLLAYFFFIGLAMMFMGIALGTVHWYEQGDVDIGLFKQCTNDDCIDIDDDDIDKSKGLCVAAISMYSATIMAVLLFLICRKRKPRSKMQGYMALIKAIAGAGLGIAGVANFVSYAHDQEDRLNTSGNFGFSLYLAVLSAILAILAGISAFLTCRASVNKYLESEAAKGENTPTNNTNTSSHPPGNYHTQQPYNQPVYPSAPMGTQPAANNQGHGMQQRQYPQPQQYPQHQQYPQPQQYPQHQQY